MKITVSTVFVIVLISINACSSRQIYESVQYDQRLDCKEVPYSEYDECMERANVSYDEYKEKREEVLREK